MSAGLLEPTHFGRIQGPGNQTNNDNDNLFPCSSQLEIVPRGPSQHLEDSGNQKRRLYLPQAPTHPQNLTLQTFSNPIPKERQWRAAVKKLWRKKQAWGPGPAPQLVNNVPWHKPPDLPVPQFPLLWKRPLGGCWVIGNTLSPVPSTWQVLHKPPVLTTIIKISASEASRPPFP